MRKLLKHKSREDRALTQAEMTHARPMLLHGELAGQLGLYNLEDLEVVTLDTVLPRTPPELTEHIRVALGGTWPSSHRSTKDQKSGGKETT